MISTQRKEEQEALKKLMRGEISAIEAYDKALENLDNASYRAKLTDIKTDHEKTSLELSALMDSKGYEVEKESGAWGSFVENFVGASSYAGDNVMLKSLKQGEEHGRRQCANLLESEHISQDTKKIVENMFKNRIEGHINTLERLPN